MANSLSKNTCLTEILLVYIYQKHFEIPSWRLEFICEAKKVLGLQKVYSNPGYTVSDVTYKDWKDTTVIPAQAQTLTWCKFSNIFWSLSQDTPVNQIQSATTIILVNDSASWVVLSVRPGSCQSSGGYPLANCRLYSYIFH